MRLTIFPAVLDVEGVGYHAGLVVEAVPELLQLDSMVVAASKSGRESDENVTIGLQQLRGN